MDKQLASESSTPPVFIVRAERKGEAEETNLRDGVCSIGWHDTPNPFYHTKAEIDAYGATHWLNEQGQPAPDAADIIWRFAHAPELDQAIIILPRLDPKHYGEVLLGRCTSTAFWDYSARGTEDSPYLRRHVKWHDKPLHRSDFSGETQNWLNVVRYTVRQVRDAVVARDILEHAAELGL